MARTVKVCFYSISGLSIVVSLYGNYIGRIKVLLNFFNVELNRASYPDRSVENIITSSIPLIYTPQLLDLC